MIGASTKRDPADYGFPAASWKNAVDLLPVVILAMNAAGDVEFANKAWLRLTGYPDARVVLGRRWIDIVHPDDVLRVRAAWDRSLAGGEPLEIQHRIRRADGSYRWLLGTAAPVRVDGTIVYWHATATDIHAWKVAQERLTTRELQRETSERSFRALAEAAPVILWTATADGWLDWFNGRWYEFTGLTNDEASGWGWQAAHHPEDFPEVMRRWPSCIASGEPFEMEFRLRAADGSFHWFLTRARPLRDDDGAILRWYGSNINIDAGRRERDRNARIAQTLQRMFLPKRLPHDAGVRFDAVYMPAEKDTLVGGDWYDAIALNDGRIAFSIGDVAGHGLDASVVSGCLRQAIYALSFRVADPAEILRELNRIVLHQFPDTIVTALVGFIDKDRRALRYANAGHPLPIVAHERGRAGPEEPFGTIPLGVLAELGTVTSTEIHVAPDTVVAFYTDGLIEAGRDITAGERVLREIVSRFVGDITTPRPADVVLRDALRDTPPADDAALMIVQFSNVPLETLGRTPPPLQKVWRFHSSDAYTAHASRQELTHYLEALAVDPKDTFAAELVLGEIFANTVEHAPGLVEIDIDWAAEKPVLIVRDTGPGIPSVKQDLPVDPLEENGRGLFLIRTLADDVTLRALDGIGTELRATLPVKRRMTVLLPRR